LTSVVADATPDVRGQLSSIRALLGLTMVMIRSGDADEILRLAATAVGSFGRCRTDAIRLDGAWYDIGGSTSQAHLQQLTARLAQLGPADGTVDIPGRSWAFAYALTSQETAPGHMIVSAADEPGEHDRYLIKVLVQQTAAALDNARVRARERAISEDLLEANAALDRSVAVVQHNLDVHERLNRVTAAGEGPEGIARAVHELTGCAVAIEDRHGNLRWWAGPDRPTPYPKDSATRRNKLLERALEAIAPIRDRRRLVALASAGSEILGVIALVDPKEGTQKTDQLTLSYAATVLAGELSHLRNVAEAELRVRRDLVEELLVGTDAPSARERARALGYDLERPHRVLVVEGSGRRLEHDAVFHAVRQAARDLDVGTLLVARAGGVAVLCNHDQDWERFRQTICELLGVGGRCRIGVGGTCTEPGDFPRSHHEAQLALKVQRSAGADDRVTVYEELGVYRMFAEIPDGAVTGEFVRRWLGPLLDYDARKGSQLVATVAAYLESGGSYDATASALSLHRNSLRYRLQRIRDISGLDLTDADTRFNLQLATRAWSTLRAVTQP
jgi:sugar diacid utilization regulator